MAASPSLDCTDQNMYVRYGSGSVHGPICRDYVKVYNTQDMRVNMPFILSKQNRPFDSFWAYDGIMGFSPSDDSSGPLYIDYLYKTDKIAMKVFSILPQGNEDKKELPKITYGGYQKEEVTPVEKQYFYKENLNTILAHRVSGSFHWELDVNRV